jgi:hypothetical protein
MDYGKSFSYVFEDENWISKFLVGVVITLIPIVNFASYGYMIQVLKNVRDGEAHLLPEWDDFGKYFMDGLKSIVGFLVYFIPVFLLNIMMIPVAIVADNGGVTGDAVGVVMACLGCLMLLFILVPMFLYPALYIQYAKDDQISDMFKLSDMWELIQEDLGNYVIVLVMIFFVLGLIASLGFLLCFVGIFLTGWYVQLVSAHMFGQLAQPKEKPATI